MLGGELAIARVEAGDGRHLLGRAGRRVQHAGGVQFHPEAREWSFYLFNWVRGYWFTERTFGLRSRSRLRGRLEARRLGRQLLFDEAGELAGFELTAERGGRAGFLEDGVDAVMDGRPGVGVAASLAMQEAGEVEAGSEGRGTVPLFLLLALGEGLGLGAGLAVEVEVLELVGAEDARLVGPVVALHIIN